ncbi:cyclic nucleotide-binding domain-containing protein [Aestuariirhabdus sp. LZHN29]|uniref:cyclic nucleotide-binding domain-containing protein n=1 Tax=Aestuariirhabdus sp. LZHN29 TaxID=3417462 RepID=UPI003CEA6B57
MNIKQLLMNNSLFEQLTADELDQVVELMRPHELPANTTVFKEGGHGNYVCFVMEGTLQVLKSRDNGQESVIATIGEGQSVGEMAIIDGLPRSATVRSVTASSLLLLKRDDFNTLLSRHPETAAKILKAIAKMLSIHLRKTSGELSNLLFA